jgi:L-fuconolactonase
VSTRPARIVDAHVHLWDPTRTEWYPYLAGQMEIGMGDVQGMARRFDLATYQAEAAGWNVDKLVNVAAATGHHSIDETLAMSARGEADALIGGIAPAGSVAESVAQIDRQMEADRFRGVRPMGRFAGPLPDGDVLRELAARGLVLEVLARPEQLEAAARGLVAHDDLVVVIEHTGWPQPGTERETWTAGIDALASLGPNVHCKLSGLSGAAGRISAAAFAPWLEPAIEAFGVERCFVASNFPVDGLHGSLDELWGAFDGVTAGLGAEAREQLFAGNAEGVYRI